MKQLQIVKTQPDSTTEFLMKALSEGKEVTRVNLYENPNYDELIKLVFDHEEIISWW